MLKPWVHRLLPSLTLLEWGGILTYFYVSHRLTAFLHPHFRPMVLVTGLLLLITAACVLFIGNDATLQTGDDCDDLDCEHSHVRLTPGAMLAFVVLLLPIALAATISPDGYGIRLIENRGAAESLENAPAIMASQAAAETSRSAVAASPVYVGVDVPVETPQADNLPKGWTPPNAPEFTQSKNVPDDEDYPSAGDIAAKLRADSRVTFADAKKLSLKSTPLRALNERPGAQTPLGNLDDVLGRADSVLRDSGISALKPIDNSSFLPVEVVDLLIAAQKPELRKEMTGKRVELAGQVLAANGGGFRILRLLVLCCAADAQPLAVRIETKQPNSLPQMAWAKVAGKLSFEKKGSVTIPVISAESVTSIKQPDEPYLY